MVIKRLNMCCLFFWQRGFFFIALLKLSKMKSLQDFLSDFVVIFVWKIIVSSDNK